MATSDFTDFLDDLTLPSPPEDRPSGSLSRAGLLLRIRARVVSKEEVERLLDVLERTATLEFTAKNERAFKRLFFVARMLALYAARYQERQEIGFLLSRCAREAGRIAGEID